MTYERPLTAAYRPRVLPPIHDDQHALAQLCHKAVDATAPLNRSATTFSSRFGMAIRTQGHRCQRTNDSPQFHGGEPRYQVGTCVASMVSILFYIDQSYIGAPYGQIRDARRLPA